MCKAYGITPSKYLFPSINNPILQYAIDSHIFTIGENYVIKNNAELENQKMKYYTELITALAGVR